MMGHIEVYIREFGLPEKVAMSKVYACIEKGWSRDKIQKALDFWAHQNAEDYNYKY